MGKQIESDDKLQRELKKSGEIPIHIAIIMDGNGRWARKEVYPGLPVIRRGVDTVRDIVEACAETGS